MRKFKLAQAGVGVRGGFHLRGLAENADRYEIVGLCDLLPDKAAAAAEQYGLNVSIYTDAETMLAKEKPDVFVFVTHPDVRVSMVELAVKYGVRGLSFEKPMALNLGDARYLRDLCNANRVKAVVSHQQKYSQQMQRIYHMVSNGDIGALQKIHCETQSWMAQLGTHFLDYALWISGGNHRVLSAVGHVHGGWCLGDSHPSPDYILGEAKLDNNTRIYLECGYFGQRRPYVPRYGYDNRITAYGTHGYLWAETDGRCGGFTRNSSGEPFEEIYPIWDEQEPLLQIPYYRDFGCWLEDDKQVHPCNIDISYHGYEVLEGICLSALDFTRMDFPITRFDYTPVLERMQGVLHDVDSPRRRTWIEYMD